MLPRPRRQACQGSVALILMRGFLIAFAFRFVADSATIQGRKNLPIQNVVHAIGRAFFVLGAFSRPFQIDRAT